MSTLQERIDALEAKQLKRELPEPIAAALESRPKTLTAATEPTEDKEANRAAIWNAVQALPGWEKVPGGARYVGTRGIAMLVGRPSAFTAGGTSTKSREFDTLEEAITAAHKIGGAVKKSEDEDGEKEDLPEDLDPDKKDDEEEDEEGEEEPSVPENIGDRAYSAVAKALGAEEEIVERRQGVLFKKRVVKVEIGLEDLATQVQAKAEEIMALEKCTEEEALAKAVTEIVPAIPGQAIPEGGEIAKAAPPMPGESGQEPTSPEEAVAEEPPAEEDPDKVLTDKIAARVLELVEQEGTAPDEAVRIAIREVLESEPEEDLAAPAVAAKAAPTVVAQ